MASTISAGTTSGTAIAITGDTTGNLAFTTQAGTYTQTLPNATGTVMVTGNMPTFSAYTSTNSTLTNNAYTKVNFQTEEYDTNNNFASSRFTPTVAGYYILSSTIAFTGPVITESVIVLYKNGSAFKFGSDIIPTTMYITQGTWQVYANGSTDYFEIYVYQNSARDVNSGQSQSFFTGSMIRSA